MSKVITNTVKKDDVVTIGEPPVKITKKTQKKPRVSTEETLNISGKIDDSINNGNVKPAGEVLIFYECRCSDEMISRMVENMSAPDRQEMFGDLLQLEIECPRCGRKYAVTRPDTNVH